MDPSSHSKRSIVDSHLPLYLQIREALRKAILDGKYQPLERLPSESQLMQTYQVSRMTIRQALRDLYGEGLIFSSQGKGTFVTKPSATHSIHRRIDDFGQLLADRGQELQTEVLAIEHVTPESPMLAGLVDDGVENPTVLRIERLRYLCRQPVCHEWFHLPARLEKHLMGQDLTGDVRAMIENLSRLRISASRVRIEAVHGNSDTLRHLGLADGEPVLRVTRTSQGEDGRPIAIDHLWFDGRAFAYEFSVDHRGVTAP